MANDQLRQRLIQALAQVKPRRITDSSRIRAGVLVPLYCKQGELYVIFTKRTETVRNHKGEISFPGGVYEDKDGKPLVTALREADEEIGLKTEDVEILGELDDELSAQTNYVISPFVALVPWPYQYRLSVDETEEIIEVPMQALLEKGSRRRETQMMHGRLTATYLYHYQGRVIWGATARILKKLLDALDIPNQGSICGE